MTAKKILNPMPALSVTSLRLRLKIANAKAMPEVLPSANCIQKLNRLTTRKVAANLALVGAGSTEFNSLLIIYLFYCNRNIFVQKLFDFKN
jgi:hypothetical protein